MPDPPPELSALQQAFARAIRTPIRLDRPGGRLDTGAYPADLVAELRPNAHLSGRERLAIYNQQYWFRLLGVMQKELPLLRRILGLETFNQLAIDYLDQCPSQAPSLHLLCDRLADFIAAAPRWSRPAIRQAAALDLAHQQAFGAPAGPALQRGGRAPAAMARLLAAPLGFRLGWCLYVTDFDCVAQRRIAVADPDEDGLLELSPQPAWWVIHRGPTRVVETPIDPLQHALLSRLAAGEGLGAACAGLSAEASPGDLQRLGREIQHWFAHWAALGWFAEPAAPGRAPTDPHR